MIIKSPIPVSAGIMELLSSWPAPVPVSKKKKSKK